MTTPTVRFELSLADPTSAPEWLDETPYLRSFSVSRGRDNELDRSRAGTATLRVDNRDGRYVPSNTAGAHYPNMRPTRRVRLSTEMASGLDPFLIGDSFVGDTDYLGAGATITYYLFSGFIDDWPQTWDPSNRDAVAQIDATDGFIALSLAEFNLTFPLSAINDSAGARILRTLQAVGWQQSEEDPEWTVKFDNGTVIILGEYPPGTDIEVHEKALDYIQKVAETEGGNVFIDGIGDFNFHDADHLLDLDPSEIYGDLDPETGYTDIELTTGADRIYNDIEVSVSPANVDTVRITSPTSIARFWRRSLDMSLLAAIPITGADTITQRRSRQLRDRYAFPRMRITRLVLRPTTEALWNQVLAHEIGDAVNVRKRLPAGDTIDQVSLIEGIAIESPDQFDWQVTWTLSAHFDEPVSLLTENQQSLETDTTGWIAETGCSISRVQTIAYDGTASLEITPSATPAKVKTDPATAIPVTVGYDYRGVGTFIGGRSSQVRLEIDWLDSTSAVLSTSTGTAQQVLDRSWRFFEVEGTAPTGAVYAVLRIHNFNNDDLGVLHGDLFDFYQLIPTVAIPPPPDTGGPKWFLFIH